MKSQGGSEKGRGLPSGALLQLLGPVTDSMRAGRGLAREYLGSNVPTESSRNNPRYYTLG